jgi:hypothetical protein
MVFFVFPALGETAMKSRLRLLVGGTRHTGAAVIRIKAERNRDSCIFKSRNEKDRLA